jgi:hypothetical protein
VASVLNIHAGFQIKAATPADANTEIHLEPFGIADVVRG